ncbi:MAG TPA: hypothetical protein VGR84_01935 [Candidatus Acidoferrales bacterium]|nr:hypothetical protein [Candidatus Acidoferrales bacterium]
MRKHWEKAQQHNKASGITGHAVYERYSTALPVRAEVVAKHLDTFSGIFTRLFSDEHFVTLLRAESMSSIPGFLKLMLQREENTLQ